MTPMYRRIICLGIAIALFFLQPAAAWASVNPSELAKAVEAIEQLDGCDRAWPPSWKARRKNLLRTP